MMIEWLAQPDGTPYVGMIVTSTVIGFKTEDRGKYIEVTTRNSIYTLREYERNRNFEYIRRKYPDKEETWRKVTQLVKFDENLEVKSVHDFNMECYISSFGRLIRNGILCNMAYGDKYDISSMFTDTDGNQVRFKRHQIVMQTFFMGDRRRYDTVDHINNMERFDNSIYNLRWRIRAYSAETVRTSQGNTEWLSA